MAKKREIEETLNELVILVESQQKCLESSDSLLRVKDLRIEILEDQKEWLSKKSNILTLCLCAILLIDVIIGIIRF